MTIEEQILERIYARYSKTFEKFADAKKALKEGAMSPKQKVKAEIDKKTSDQRARQNYEGDKKALKEEKKTTFIQRHITDKDGQPKVHKMYDKKRRGFGIKGYPNPSTPQTIKRNENKPESKNPKKRRFIKEDDVDGGFLFRPKYETKIGQWGETPSGKSARKTLAKEVKGKRKERDERLAKTPKDVHKERIGRLEERGKEAIARKKGPKAQTALWKQQKKDAKKKTPIKEKIKKAAAAAAIAVPATTGQAGDTVMKIGLGKTAMHRYDLNIPGIPKSWKKTQTKRRDYEKAPNKVSENPSKNPVKEKGREELPPQTKPGYTYVGKDKSGKHTWYKNKIVSKRLTSILSSVDPSFRQSLIQASIIDKMEASVKRIQRGKF